MIGLLDTLHLEKVTLIGFSFSGNEITRFAERYPARVSRLVYIDAAFEHSRPEQATVFGNLPILPQPASSDVGSLNAFRSFAQKVWYPGDAWTNTMEAVLRDFVTVGPNGSVTIPSDRVTPSMQAIQSRYRRDYSLITCPVWAIMPECYEHVPVGVADKTRAAMAHWHANQFVPYQRAMVEAQTRGIPSVRIVRLKGLGHNGLPVSARAQIISMLETFLTPAVPAQQSTGRRLAQLSR